MVFVGWSCRAFRAFLVVAAATVLQSDARGEALYEQILYVFRGIQASETAGRSRGPSGLIPPLAPNAGGIAPRRTLESWNTNPTGGNFSDWRGLLDNKIARYCSQGGNQFEGGLFYNGRNPEVNLLSSTFYLDSFQEFLPMVTSGFSNSEVFRYIDSKGRWIALIAIGLVILIVGIVVALAANKTVRARYARTICLCFGRGPRPRSDAFIWAPYLTIFVAIVIFVALFFAFGVVLAIKARKFHVNVNQSLCDVFIMAKGVFFGAEAMTGAPGLRTDWRGTQPQLELLENLYRQVVPTDLNPIKVNVTTQYTDVVKPGLQFAVDSSRAAVTQWQEYLKDLKSLMVTMVNDTQVTQRGRLSNGMSLPTTDLKWVLFDTTDVKMQQYVDELQQSALVGMNAIEASLGKYLGNKSLLLWEATAAVSSAIVSLWDVDYILATIINLIVMLAPTMDGLVVGAVVIISLLAVVCILVAILGGVTYGYLFKHFFKKTVPEDWIEQALLTIFVITAVFGGLSLVVSGFLFLSSSVGTDVCFFMNDTLISQGNWDVLPAAYWNETLFNATNMRSVLDTCATATGTGAIADALATTGTIHDLEETVNRSAGEMMALQDEILDYKHKITQAVDLQILLSVAPTNLFPARDTSETNYLWNETADIGKAFTTRYPSAVSSKPELEPLRYFCVVPLYGASSLTQALQICGDDLVVSGIGLGALIEIVNDKAALYADPSDPNVVTKWCLSSLSMDPNFVGGCPVGATVITADFPADKTLFADTRVQATYKSILGTAGKEEAEKWVDALYSAVQLEKLAQYTVVSGAPRWPSYQCPDAAPICAFHTIIPPMTDNFTSFGTSLVNTVDNVTDIVQSFVQDSVVAEMFYLLSTGYSALRNFDCQFIGTALLYHVVPGLCHSAMPRLTMLGWSAAWIFFSSFITCIVTWFNWRYLHIYKNGNGTGKFADVLSIVSVDELSVG